MLAAEIRHRAAGDASFLLPAAHSVKGAGVRDQASGIKNCPILILDTRYLIPDTRYLSAGLAWQEWRDSNPQPPVLETGALAIELHS
jgi:hypothetical protein